MLGKKHDRNVARWGVAVLLAIAGACSGSSASVTSDAGRDTAGSVNDSSAEDHPEDAGTYACAKEYFVSADRSGMAVPDSGSPALCVVGQTYCAVSLPRSAVGEAPAVCGEVPAKCAQDPTCACFCDGMRGGFPCFLGATWYSDQCACSDTNGFVTIACETI